MKKDQEKIWNLGVGEQELQLRRNGEIGMAARARVLVERIQCQREYRPGWFWKRWRRRNLARSLVVQCASMFSRGCSC